MGAHCLFDQSRIMLSEQTVRLGFFAHLGKQPAAFELDE